ncbi:MAG: hypothetical protein C0401_08595 [Anaerolinea sp.]|nr:hypothetical protein [Anaerolinea sp.]
MAPVSTGFTAAAISKINFQVYQRAGKKCLRCGSIIERTVINQRGTHFCPTCQPCGK